MATSVPVPNCEAMSDQFMAILLHVFLKNGLAEVSWLSLTNIGYCGHCQEWK